MLAQIARHCQSDVARAELAASEPLTDREAARVAVRRSGETLALTRGGNRLPTVPVPGFDDALSRLSVRASLTGKELFELARVFGAARAIRSHIERHRELTPELRRVLLAPVTLERVATAITRAVGSDGTLFDHASPELQTARGEVGTVRKRLQVELNRLVKRHASVLQGQYFAERDGRYVLPVRSDAEQKPRGFVLDASSSGSTLYIEPHELHDLGNDLRVAEAEVERIEALLLAELSGHVSDVLDEARQAIATCLAADKLQAIATWAAEVNANVIEPSAEPVLRLFGARHPLLCREGNHVVPNDVAVSAEQVLVLSGPNAGGKTVNLKLLGLAAWMVRAGLPLPVEPRSEVGWFDTVVSDIGDDQSLSMSLSTFSAHIQNVAACLEHAHRGTLVLLDELAGGTDPDQGSALAVTLLEELRQRGAAVVVTTHYERVKALAQPEEATYLNASVGFDAERMQPTFVLGLGVPGTSAAFAVARRFGIDAELVERAQRAMPRDVELRQNLTQDLETERNRLREANVRVVLQTEELSRKEAQLGRQLDNLRRQQAAELDRDIAALTEEVRVAREKLRDASRVISRGQAPGELKQAERWINEAAREVSIGGKLAEVRTKGTRPSEPEAPVALEPGMSVWVKKLNALGKVLSVAPHGKLQVTLGSMKLSLSDADVEFRGSKPAAPSPKSAANSAKNHSKGRGKDGGETSGFDMKTSAPLRHPGNSLELIGMRVEPALEKLDLFIDRLLRADEAAGFVVHGHGTGALRNAVREHLSGHPSVLSVNAADPESGGEALTIFSF